LQMWSRSTSALLRISLWKADTAGPLYGITSLQALVWMGVTTHTSSCELGEQQLGHKQVACACGSKCCAQRYQACVPCNALAEEPPLYIYTISRCNAAGPTRQQEFFFY
jgi:hypothetical protein